MLKMSAETVFKSLTELKSHLSKMDKEKAAKKVFILFTGSKDESGDSWCPDCVKADPIIHSCLKYLPENSEFLTCYVGDRPT